LTRFYDALVSNRAGINGSRLVYPMEKQRCDSSTYWATSFCRHVFVRPRPALQRRFAAQKCSPVRITKIWRRIKYFGEFDPFGNFDLIFVAARMALRIVECQFITANAPMANQHQSLAAWVILLRMLRFAAGRIKFI
jgi:hypothetical protein